MAFLIMRNNKRLPRWPAAIGGIGLAMGHAGHALAAANTLGGMAIGSTADLVDTSSWGTLILWLFAIGFLVAGIYHAVMHRNGRSTVPIVGVALMLLLSGACLGAPFLMGARARSLTGAAPAIDQATAVQPFPGQ